MINKVSFTGRETMLTAGLNKVEDKLSVIKASSILPKLKNPVLKQDPVISIYTSPFAPIDNAVFVKPKSETGFNISGLDFFG